jgi:hypothetical protein
MGIGQAAIITAYKSPRELDRLLEAIHGDMVCYVHLDIKSAGKFAGVRKRYPDVSFLSLFDVTWGGYEHLHAIVRLLDEALLDPTWGYIHIISGEDYPVTPPHVMSELLGADNRIYTKPFLATERNYIANKWYRYRWPYTMFHMNYRKSLTRMFNIACVLLQMTMPFLSRSSIGKETEIYHSMVWGTYPRDSMEYVSSYLKSEPAFLRDLRSCKIPEELCFATILMNSSFKDRVAYEYKRYWHMQAGYWGPPYLDSNDVEAVLLSDAFWAREVEADGPVGKALRKHLGFE